MSDINKLVLEVLSDIPDNDAVDHLKNIHQHIKNKLNSIDTDKITSKVKDGAKHVYDSAKKLMSTSDSKPDSSQTIHKFKNVVSNAKEHINKVSDVHNKASNFVNHIKDNKHAINLGSKATELGEKIGGKTGGEVLGKAAHAVGKGADFAEKHSSKVIPTVAGASGLAAGGLAATYLANRRNKK